MKYCYSIDIGGTTVKYSLFDENGNMLRNWSLRTNTAEKGRYILSDIAVTLQADMDSENIQKQDVLGIGVGVPGNVNEQGVVRLAPNLGWRNYQVRYRLGALLPGIPVYTLNDANAAALGEYWMTTGNGVQSMVMLTLGTGVGGGIILDGKVISGSNGAGGEIGHMHVEDRETQRCSCGNTGCLEQYSSATGVVRVCGRFLAKDTKKTSVLHANPDFSAKEVFDAWKQGDLVAEKAVECLGNYLGKACASVACILNPDLFVIGGGVSGAGQPLLELVESYFRKYAYPPCRDTAFSLASLGNNAGIYGMAYYVLQNSAEKL